MEEVIQIVEVKPENLLCQKLIKEIEIEINKNILDTIYENKEKGNI